MPFRKPALGLPDRGRLYVSLVSRGRIIDRVGRSTPHHAPSLEFNVRPSSQTSPWRS